jgi:hypothetical protein
LETLPSILENAGGTISFSSSSISRFKSWWYLKARTGGSMLWFFSPILPIFLNQWLQLQKMTSLWGCFGKLPKLVRIISTPYVPNSGGHKRFNCGGRPQSSAKVSVALFVVFFSGYTGTGQSPEIKFATRFLGWKRNFALSWSRIVCCFYSVAKSTPRGASPRFILRMVELSLVLAKGRKYCNGSKTRDIRMIG